MAEARKARAVGFNHVAIEVGDIDEGPTRKVVEIVTFDTTSQRGAAGLLQIEQRLYARLVESPNGPRKQSDWAGDDPRRNSGVRHGRAEP